MVFAATFLVHALEGRMRLKLPRVKGNPQEARDLEQVLNQVPGMEKVVVNPVTGSVLIFYRPHIITQQKLMLFLVEKGYLPCWPEVSRPRAVSEIFQGLVGRLAMALFEAALVRVILGLK